MIDKEKLIENIVNHLKREFATLATNAMEARDAATNEESKAENKYDTRGLEASYLAGAQAKRAQELRQIITQFEKLQPQSFNESTPINSTAIVHVRIDDEEERVFFLLAQKGGMKISIDNHEVYTLSMNSPLGQLMLNKKQGEDFEFKVGDETKEYVIESVY